MIESKACDSCIHASECMERRGQCTEYRNYQDIIRRAMADIARLNREGSEGHGASEPGSDKEGD